MTKRISLWASPRNISTAIMYSFAQRQDCSVVDEPLYGFYLKNSPAIEYHPGAHEIINSMETDEKKLKEFLLGDFSTPVVFFKNMTHHLLHFDQAVFENLSNVILTRHPKEMIASFAKVIEKPTLEDIGYRDQVELLKALNKKKYNLLVVDATRFLKNPIEGLQKICDFANIAFDESMLQWKAEPRKEDGIWAKYWYGNIHNSTGFKPYKEKTIDLPEHLENLYSQALPYYEELINVNNG